MKRDMNNFARVVDWLRLNGKIKNQKELAERIGTTATTISRIKIGFVKRADEETLSKFNAIFGDIINIAYLRGESNVMLVADLHEQAKNDTSVNYQNSNYSTRNQEITSQDISNMVTAVIASKDESIAALKRELAAKDATIAAKDDLITLLRQQILDLRNL